jgi:hypothetical protein
MKAKIFNAWIKLIYVKGDLDDGTDFAIIMSVTTWHGI